MDGTPTWFLKSKRIWGIVIMVASSVAPLFGVTLPGSFEVLSAAPDLIGQLVGAGLALYGSIKARGGLSLTPT